MGQGVLIGITLVYTVLLLGLLAAGKEENKKKYYVRAKTITSLGFILASLLCAAASGNWRLEWEIMPSLLLCMAGDVYLAKYQTGGKKKHMLMGIASFLLAHIGFLVFLYSISPGSGWYTLAAPVSAVCLFLFCVRKFHLKLGSLRWPTIFYSLFVSSMMAKALAVMYMAQDKAFWYIGWGGILFFLSDFSIIFLYFYHFEKKGHRRYVQIFNLVTYYYAILFFDFFLLLYTV